MDLTSTSLFAGVDGASRAQLDQLLPVVYDDLRRRARGFLRSDRRGELQPTALVHEAYLRLAERQARWVGRTHFCALAAVAMRQVLVDYIRRNGRAKRGGDALVVTLDETVAFAGDASLDMFALNEALERLVELNPRHGKIVELRFFGGLTVEEVAEVLGVSRATVENDWTFAKAWLRRQLAKRDAR